MLTVSDQIQIPPKTTHKDTGTKVNESYYFISYYSVNKSIFFLLANTAFGLPVCQVEKSTSTKNNKSETFYQKWPKDFCRL